MKNLISQDFLDKECPGMVKAIEDFLDENPLFKEKEEALVYALAQIVSVRIGMLPMKDEDKGAVISTILSGFIELCGSELAAYNELRKVILEQKASTVH